MRLRNVKNKEQIMNNSSCLIKNPNIYKGKWKTLFGNNNPIYIEIGMGKGQFILENAKKYPNINFIGIEKYDSVIVRALEKVPEEVNNLYMIRMDAIDIDLVFDKEIDRIFLNFSDPWPKLRHHSRRLTSLQFLKKYDKIFLDDCFIEIRTDNYELYIFSLLSLSESGYVFKKLSFDLHNDEMPLITTEYEDKFSNKGMPIYYIACCKTNVKKCKKK